MGVVRISHVTRVSTNNNIVQRRPPGCSGSSSSTSESSSTASCRPSNSSASGADDDTIPTDTTASSTDSEALSLLEKLRAPSKKEKNCGHICSCQFMMRHALHVLFKHNSHFLSIMIWSSSIIRKKIGNCGITFSAEI